MPEIPRLPDGLQATLPRTVVMPLVLVFMQLAENLAQWGRATGLVEFAFEDFERMGHDVGQV